MHDVNVTWPSIYQRKIHDIFSHDVFSAPTGRHFCHQYSRPTVHRSDFATAWPGGIWRPRGPPEQRSKGVTAAAKGRKMQWALWYMSMFKFQIIRTEMAQMGNRVHNGREMISNILISAVKQPNIDQRYNIPGLQWWGYLHSRQVLHSNVVARGRLEWKMHEISCRVYCCRSKKVWHKSRMKIFHDVQGFKPFTSWFEDRTP